MSTFGLRTRMTLAAALGVTMVLAILTVLILREARDLDRGYTAFSAAEAAILIEASLDAGENPNDLLVEAPPGTTVVVDTSDGITFTYGPPNLIDAIEDEPYQEQRARLIEPAGQALMLYDSPCRIDGTEQCRMRVAIPDTPLIDFLRNVWWDVARIALPVLALVVIAVPFLSGRALRDVGRMTRQVTAITDANSLHQLVVPSADDELRELATTLNDLLRRLHHAHREQQRFIADASHELRSPAAAIQLTTEMANRYQDRRHDDATWDRLTAEANRLSRVVTQLLDHTRAGMPPTALEAVDLVHIAEHQQARHSTVPITINGTRPAFALATQTYAETIITNLVDNALRHATTRVDIMITSDAPTRWRVEVTDDGPGVPAGDHDRIFEPFARLDQARNRADGGTGLGLTIARAAARACGGDLRVSTEHPSTFVFTIPSAEHGLDAAPIPAETDTPAAGVSHPTD